MNNLSPPTPNKLSLIAPITAIRGRAVLHAGSPRRGARRHFFRLSVCLGLVLAGVVEGADRESFTRVRDVIYGRSYGTSLTMDVFQPRAPSNGRGVILMVSGSWISNLNQITSRFKQVIPFTDRGYTVFGVLHRSQPRYAIPDMAEDISRSVRYIRYHAKDYGVDPDRLGIYGASSGGHLALLQAMAGDAGNPEAKDPIERVSSRVQAAGVLRPPTDFLNYGKPGESAMGRGLLGRFQPIFEFLEQNPETKAFERVGDPARIEAIARAVSPVTHVTADDPPTLIIHGAIDKLVPIQQAELIVGKLRSVGVEAKVIAKPGIGHGTFPNQQEDVARIADWFDIHLRK
jgi:acetyl esterase/lipase